MECIRASLRLVPTIGHVFSKQHESVAHYTIPLLNYVQARGFAARRGTRAKMAKKRVKLEVKKVGFIPHNLRAKSEAKMSVSRRIRERSQSSPIDDVWIQKFFAWKMYDAEDAIECIRETHHPQIYNAPSAPLRVIIELDMTGPKKNKYVDPFSKIASIPHPFNHGEDRSVLVFCKTPELKDQADSAGATLVGDVDTLKKVEKGDIMLPDFQFIVAHPNILPELSGLRGLLKKKFPSPKNGTLGANIGEMVTTLRTGIRYLAQRDDSELDYGFIDTCIGPLDMDKKHLVENLAALLENVSTARPKRSGPFITRVLMFSPPSKEKMKVNLAQFIGEDGDSAEGDSDSDEETPLAKVKVN